MGQAAATIGGADRLGEAALPRTIAGLLLLAAVLFNAGLAIVNAQLTPLTSGMVIACEVAIVASAHLVALLYFRVRMAPWYALILALAAFAVFRGLTTGALEVKYLRDVLLIPSFVILGMAFPRDRLPGLLVSLQLIVLAGLALEALAPAAYSELFAIKSYYINTRGYEEASFWNTASDLFVSASRPDDRFFSFIDAHRMSSVFLEPVSLGNYSIVIAAYVFASYRMLSGFQRVVLLGGTALLIIGCDGRLAAVACVIILIASLFAARLPAYASMIIAPAALMAALAAVSLLDLRAGSDDFPGRIAHTAQLLRSYGLPEYMGISDLYLSRAVDSGLAYLIATQSVLGVLLIWITFILATEERSRQEVVFKTAVALYIALTMLVSFSFLSIKTASLLWFILGAMQPGRDRLPALVARWRRPARLAPERQARLG